MSQASGLEKISSEAIDAAKADFVDRSAQAQGEQLPLLDVDQGDDLPDLSDDENYHGLPDSGEIMAIMADNPGYGVAEAVIEHRRRTGKGGRKKGSTNKRSDDFARYMLQFGPHPGITMQRIQARPLEILAAELGCSKHQAAQLQIRCADAMMPYFESKKPVGLDIRAVGDFSIEIGDFMGSPVAAVTSDPDSLELGFAEYEETEQNQTDSNGEQEKSE